MAWRSEHQVIACLAVVWSCGGDREGDAGTGSAPAASTPWEMPLEARFELSTAGKPEGVAIADVDGDGRAELLAVTREPGALCVWSGARTDPRAIPLGDYPLGPLLVSTGERTLVAVASRATRELWLLDLAATDPLAAAARFELPGTPRAIGQGDVGGDGVSDLAVATREGALHLFGGGARRDVELAEAQATFVAVTREGVLVGSQAGASVRAYTLDATGALAPAGEAIALGGIPRAHRVADFDGDGESEHLVAGGDGALWRIDDPFGAPRVQRLAVDPGDVPLDIETVAGTSGPLLITLSFRDLSYSTWRAGVAIHREYAGQDAWDAAAGDLDGDGRFDLAFALRDARRVSVVMGDDRGSFREAVRVPVAHGPHSLATADLDGDGEREILVLCAKDDALCVVGRASERIERRATIPVRPSTERVRAGDLDGDGVLDLAFLDRAAEGSRLVVLRGERGRGIEAWVRSELVLGGAASDLLLADLDGDSRAEAIVADPERGRVLFARASAPGIVELAQSLALPTAPRALELLEEPGERAIAVALGEPGPRVGFALLWIETGSGSPVLVERAFLAAEGGFPIDVAILRAPAAPARIALLSKPPGSDGPGRIDVLERGAGGALAIVERHVTGLRPHSMTSGDLDGDGRDDLVASAQNSHHLNLWLGRAGGLQRLPDLGAGRGVLDVLCTDLDADGAMELVVANGFSNDLSVIR